MSLLPLCKSGIPSCTSLFALRHYSVPPLKLADFHFEQRFPYVLPRYLWYKGTKYEKKESSEKRGREKKVRWWGRCYLSRQISTLFFGSAKVRNMVTCGASRNSRQLAPASLRAKRATELRPRREESTSDPTLRVARPTSHVVYIARGRNITLRRWRSLVRWYFLQALRGPNSTPRALPIIAVDTTK